MVANKLAILLPTLTTLLMGPCKAVIPPSNKTFNTLFTFIGPFTEGCEDYQLSGIVTPLAAMESVAERMKVSLPDGTMLKTEVKPLHTITKNEFYMLTFNLPFSSYLTSLGLKISIEFLQNGQIVMDSFSFIIKPINPQRINPKDYINNYYSLYDIVVDPDNYSSGYCERFKFNQFIDYFNVDNYYRLSLNDIKITYSSIKACPPGLAHLHFVDYLKLFPYLDNDEEVPTFDIPLTALSSKSDIYFKFPSKMYVKPETLEMSLEVRPDFQQTNYFYLPINHLEDLLDQTFTLVVDSFGHGGTSFSWDIRYINNRGLVGDCSNSDYCVIGEMVNG